MLWGVVLTLILGGVAGWIASMVMDTERQQGVLLNIVVGVVGAFLANLVLAPLLGAPAVLDRISFGGFIMSVLGACLLLAIVNLLTRHRVR